MCLELGQSEMLYLLFRFIAIVFFIAGINAVDDAITILGFIQAGAIASTSVINETERTW